MMSEELNEESVVNEKEEQENQNSIEENQGPTLKKIRK